MVNADSLRKLQDNQFFPYKNMSVYFLKEPQDNTDNKRLDLEKKMSSEEGYWFCWKSITDLLIAEFCLMKRPAEN